MRNLLLALAAVATMTAIQGTPAEAGERAFCIIGGSASSNLRGDCRFDTYAQCLATASGTRSFCDRNYFYNPAANGSYPGVAPRARYYRGYR